MIREQSGNGFYEIFCSVCGIVIDETKVHTVCPHCGSSLDVHYDYRQLRKKLKGFSAGGNDLSALKYLEFYPLREKENLVSLMEGGTPLYHLEKLGKKYGLKKLFLKNEGMNPTGAFKDRGTLVEIAKAREIKAHAILVASSGNMAASCAAYGAKANMPCYVLVPDNIPVGKLSQIISYGAHVIKIRGEYDDCLRLARKLAPEHHFYLAGDYVFRREGQKSLAYELCEQFRLSPPDVVICPTGAGTHISGLWRGFMEFKNLGFVKKVPKLIAVQAEGAAVIEEAFNRKEHHCKPWKVVRTICSAVAVADPLDGDLALKAIDESRGCAVKVSDDEALKAERLLASREAVFVEPSSALAVAALPHLIQSGFLKKGQSIVIVATGNGLKDPLTLLQNLPKIVTLEAVLAVVSRYVTSHMLKSRGF